MPLILVGIPVSNVSPSDLAVAPSWARAMSDCFVSRAGPGPRPARMHPVTSPGATAAKKRRQHTLISFIWSPGNPLPAGTGGSENYTVGQVRELTRRGVAAQIVTVGLGATDGRDDFA